MKESLSSHLKVAVITLAAILTASCRPVEKADPPKLFITTESPLKVSAKGGDVTFAYSLENPDKGGELSAKSVGDCDWITAFDSKSKTGVVRVTVEANEAEEARTATIVLTYSYEADKTIEDRIDLEQAAAHNDNPDDPDEDPDNPDDPDNPVVPEDIILNASVFVGKYYGSWMSGNGTHLFETTLSSDADPAKDSLAYTFTIVSDAPADMNAPLPVSASYSLGADGEYTAGTFVSASCTRLHADGSNETIAFETGIIVFSSDDNGASFNAELTDTDGVKHIVTYTASELSYADYSQNPDDEKLSKDLTFNATQYKARVKSKSNGLSLVAMEFVDNEQGVTMFVEAYMTVPEEGIAPGEYIVSSDDRAMSIIPGSFGPTVSGTYAQYTYNMEDGESIVVIGAIGSGTMTVGERIEETSLNNGKQTIEFDLTTSEGYSVKGSFEGRISVQSLGFSTLTSDRTVNLQNATATIENKKSLDASIWDTGSSTAWELIVASPDGGDAIRFHIAANKGNVNNGIPSGSYKVQSSNSSVDNGEYVKGTMSSDMLKGSYFYSGYTSNGLPKEYAPAISGDLVIENSGNNNYNISFSITDDKEYIWSGAWNGTITNLTIANSMTTLTSDREVVFVDATATATWFAEAYFGEKVWEMVIKSANGGDCVRLVLCGKDTDFEKGVPSMKYTYAYYNDDPYEGEYLLGSKTSDGDFKYTFFFSDFDENGTPREYAPAVKDKNSYIEITNNDDGTYDITFSLKDDLSNTWYGSWNGPVELLKADEIFEF